MNPSSVASTPEPSAGDTGLIARVRSGDTEALAATYHRYAPGLLALVYRLMGSASDAEDVIQDLFVGLPEALQGYREQGRLEAWLRRVAVRLALMRMRTERRRNEVTLDGAALTTGLHHGADAHRIQRALDRLDSEQRTIVMLRAIEGYSHEEIAALLGIRRGAAQVRYHRAVTRLRTLLEDS